LAHLPFGRCAWSDPNSGYPDLGRIDPGIFAMVGRLPQLDRAAMVASDQCFGGLFEVHPLDY
jgi:hypothetical protein